MGVPATTGQLRTRIQDMEVGDYIVCEYQATSNAVGVFRNFGTSTAPEISVVGEAAPNGSFYFIKVDTGLLIADRVVQHSISWDTLNAGKVVQGKTYLIIDITLQSQLIDGGHYSSRDKAFDNTIGGFTTSAWEAPFNDRSGWVGQDFGVPKTIKSYSISATTDYPNNAPYDWTFEGSNDMVNWDILDIKIGVTNWSAGETKLFSINNNTEYRYYRINVTNCGGTSYVLIAEMEMSEIPYPFLIRSLTGGVAYSDANGNKSTTDQGTGKAFPSNSEFDKYIIGFYLSKVQNGKTLFDVFHHDVVKTWTQDTPIISIASASSRVVRGGTVGTNNFSYVVSNTANTTVGFRPVFEYKEV